MAIEKPKAMAAVTKKPPIRKTWIETPLTESAALSKAAGCRIFLKHDNLQPSGSFKSRGLGHYMTASLTSLPPTSQPKAHFYCSSGGNAGLACVHSARALSLPATIVVPRSTTPFMIAKLRAAGASEVIQQGAVWAEADAHLRAVVVPSAEGEGVVAVYVPPFDEPRIWEGHGVLVDEVARQLGSEGGARPDVIVCSSGGGGLFNGIVQGVLRQGWEKQGTQVLVMGTHGANALDACRRAGEYVSIPGITSKATSLGATKVCRRSFELLMEHEEWIRTALLSDAEAAMGCWRLADDERIMVELACGVNVALCYGGRLEKALGRKVRPEEIVVIEVCGGSGVSVELLHQWKLDYGYLEDELSRAEKRTVPSAVTNGASAH